MNRVRAFFRRYFLFSFGIIVLFILINILLLWMFLITIAGDASSPWLSTQETANMLSVDENWRVSADDRITELFSDADAWGMVLNDGGKVIWEERMPEELSRHYTASEVAIFTRWYLKDYPVFVHAMPKGLLVIGYPKGSIDKLNYIIPSSTGSPVVTWGIWIVLLNACFVMAVFWRNTRKVEKAILPALDGMISMSQGKATELPETGELAEMNTALNRTSASIVKKDAARNDWIRSISHDVRTPLSVMLGYAGEIEATLSLPEDTKRKAGIIRTQGVKLRALIADLNLSSRLEYSMQPLNVNTVFPVELTRQVVSEFLNHGLTEHDSITFEAPSAVASLAVTGDEALLARMLSNLIQNSISHNPDGCHIAISISRTASHCRLQLADDGKGISEMQFDQFNSGRFPSSEPTAEGQFSHGLGLRIVWQIIKAHKGTLTFQKNTPKGMVILIDLPISCA